MHAREHVYEASKVDLAKHNVLLDVLAREYVLKALQITIDFQNVYWLQKAPHTNAFDERLNFFLVILTSTLQRPSYGS
jgi:hypothetical protein